MGNVNTLTRRTEKTKTVAHKGAPIESGRGFFMIQIGRVNIVSKNAHRRFTPKVAELTGISGRIESEWVAELTGIRTPARLEPNRAVTTLSQPIRAHRLLP